MATSRTFAYNTGSAISGTTPQIGAQANSNGYQGKIAVAQMWTSALSSADVSTMYSVYTNRGYFF